MFTPKGLFSEITCPYRETCALPSCLFAHPKRASPDAVILRANSSPERNLVEVKAGEDGQRKRRKLEGDAVTSSGNSGSLKPASKVRDRISSANRPVSPPPLHRETEKNTLSSVKPKPKVLKVAPNSPLQVPPKALEALKTEALNPRLLKHAPASHDIRYRLLKALHDQFSRLNSEVVKDASASEETLVLSEQELIKMALDIEENIAIEKPNIYPNLVKNKILMYKRMNIKDWIAERKKTHAQTETSRFKDITSPSTAEPPKPIDTGLSEEEELEFLSKLYTPLHGLTKHGYVVTVPTEDSINQAQQGIEAAKGWEVCDRCKARFQVFPGRREEDGALTSGGICTYHWGKTFFPEKPAVDANAKRERKYRCCGELIGDSTGCTKAETHVFKVSEVKRLAAILNFAETPPNDAPSTRPVCIDGEMGYTVHGLELIRLTATSWPSGDELLDVLVRPIGEILDLNSRWSGVWPQQMADAIPWGSSAKPTNGNLCIVESPVAARDLLFTHLSPTTPLIGHGLENDLNAVRIIHPTVIDTCLLFPHTAGLPYRNGLKNLMLQYLNRIIQAQIMTDGKMAGHDSKEDARAAGDLVKWKIGERWRRMKTEGWKLEGGKFVAPTAAATADLLMAKILGEHGVRDDSTKRGTKRTISEVSADYVEGREFSDM